MAKVAEATEASKGQEQEKTAKQKGLESIRRRVNMNRVVQLLNAASNHVKPSSRAKKQFVESAQNVAAILDGRFIVTGDYPTDNAPTPGSQARFVEGTWGWLVPESEKQMMKEGRLT